jgi:hypothetical protein
MVNAVRKETFPLGRVAITETALDICEEWGTDWSVFLQRHAARDWGDIRDEDKAQNNWAADEDRRICSKYRIGPHLSFWVVTDRGGLNTTVLMPWEE